MKRTVPAALFILLSLALLNASAHAGDRPLEKQLNWDYANKVLTLRRFYEGSRLRFLSDGRLRGDASVGTWTLDGQIEVREIHLKKDLVEIKGRRIQVVFDSKSSSKHVPQPVDELTTLDRIPEKERGDIAKALRRMEVTIEIELPSSKPTAADASSVIHAVFLMPGESMIEAVPEFWRKYFASLEGRPYNTSPSAEPVFRVVTGSDVPGGVTAPKVIIQPDPEYSEQARKAKFQGTAVVSLVVDATGAARDIQIERPLGLGLDEKALAAISTWKFEPAQRDGKPVAVAIMVEVSFRLY
jgi:TonB family protein